MFLIKDKVLEKNEWYQNPMTQAFNKGLNEAESEEEMVELYFSALLEAKGLHSDHEKEKFLRAEQNEFLDPFLFKDMELACEIIGQAIEADEKILIYGDYDCDGLTATAILVRVLRDLGADVSYFVPDRLQDGYSLTDKTVDHVLLKKTDLLITVDCGINDDQEILKLMQAGIKVIVSDHHQADQDINNPALAIINPKLTNENYPFEDLAGAGVAFKLAQALTSYMNLNSYDLSFALCLAAVGTVADSMPLKNENRTMVALATSIFLKKAPLGLQMLTEKYNNSFQLSASFFGFTIGPRLNAAGRLGNLEPALRLLL
ncbi:MAG TPA: DHH family phosphoesterase, partial [Candidatus Eisenbacteria bacterium]|nr:DHH family phosphoesterase [Candidatus Eisenbacteria bacterium]